MKSKRICLPQEHQILKSYDKILARQVTSKFTKNAIRYMKLAEQVDQNQMGFHDFLIQNEQGKELRSYILDQNLSVVCKDFDVCKFQLHFRKFSNNKMSMNQQQSQQQQTQGCLQQQNKQYCSQLEQPCYYYQSYPDINNFLIGRTNFGRDFQCHKIKSDSISKNHCEIFHFKSYNNNKVSKYLRTIQNVILRYSPICSNFRKIPEGLWRQIQQFIKPRQKYFLIDLGSRNGTWVYQEGTQAYELMHGFDYQFQNQSYSINIVKTLTSLDYEGQSIKKHNERAAKMIKQFQKQVNWNYYQKANKVLIIEDIQECLQLNKLKVQVLIIKIKYKDYHQYYLLASKDSQNERKFVVGCKYQININAEQHDMPSLHGKIYVKNSKWMIETSEINRNRQFRKIWMRIPKDCKYCLNTLKKYKIKLGNIFHLKFQFINFNID